MKLMLACSVFLVGMASQSFAKELCNRSPETFHAVGAKTWNCTQSAPSGTSGLAVVDYCHEVSGWYKFEPGECKDLPFSLFYAEGVFGSVWGGQGNQKYCIRNGNAFKFSFNDAQTCDQQGGKMVSFTDSNNLEYGESTIRVCNYANREQLDLALSMYQNGGWVSEGWFSLDKGECKKLKFDDYNGDIYYYAKTGGYIWEGKSGDPKFCVDDNRFKIRDADYQNNCGQQGQSFKTFRKARLNKKGLVNLELK